jgi:hypothetical protein
LIGWTQGNGSRFRLQFLQEGFWLVVNGFTLNPSDYLAQLGPKLSASMQSQGLAFCLITLPSFQLGGSKVSYLTNISKDQLVALLKEQVGKLEVMS